MLLLSDNVPQLLRENVPAESDGVYCLLRLRTLYHGRLGRVFRGATPAVLLRRQGLMVASSCQASWPLAQLWDEHRAVSLDTPIASYHRREIALLLE